MFRSSSQSNSASLLLSSLLHVAGSPSTEYVSTETNLPALSNLHLALESHRLRSHRYQTKRAQKMAALSASERSRTLSAEQEFGDGLDFEDDAPRVMILGPEGSGKSTVAKTLINWTTRAGRDWRPVLVNLDPSEVRERFACSRMAHSGQSPLADFSSLPLLFGRVPPLHLARSP